VLPLSLWTQSSRHAAIVFRIHGDYVSVCLGSYVILPAQEHWLTLGCTMADVTLEHFQCNDKASFRRKIPYPLYPSVTRMQLCVHWQYPIHSVLPLLEWNCVHWQYPIHSVLSLLEWNCVHWQYPIYSVLPLLELNCVHWQYYIHSIFPLPDCNSVFQNNTDDMSSLYSILNYRDSNWVSSRV